ncbi:putative bicarbonate transporter, IctB family [Rubidibacter lacunae KORDI 51-2]|uniref:Putative bicarbonate transporter, IctB family n=1 Tax=Rubidibacter lacunae KORDI 51-2 TaxID=582515 RepID=U5DTI7_9CHRO|nr:IctB family putative bicarbonate transporter [Rubidibacter lacunae]ERN42995.1 putative bicarbonate transporter, IctB family [Rubidibacter lacunae KORDI 51-2]
MTAPVGCSKNSFATANAANSFLQRWRSGSWAYQLVGLFHPWRQSSWLLRWAEPLGTLLVCATFAIAPFVATGLIGLLLLATAGFWLLLTLTDRDGLGATPVHLGVLLFWCVVTIATAFSPVRDAAVSGWLKLSLYLVWFAFCTRVLRAARARNAAIAVFLLVALVVSIYGVRQQLFGVEQLATWNDPESALAGDTRAYSYLGNPNLLAGYLIAAVTLSLSAFLVWQTRSQKLLALTMFGVNGACLVFTDSRGGWIGMLAALLAFLLMLRFWWDEYLSPFWRRSLLPLSGLLGIGLVGAALGTSESLRLRATSIFAGREDSSNNFRLTVWTAVLDMIRDRPLLGIGPGNDAFNRVYPLYQRPNYDALSAYSIYLEIAVEAGFAGFTAFVALIGAIAWRARYQFLQLRERGDREGIWIVGASAAMVGMLAHGLVDTVLYRPQIATIWWFLVALVASYYGNRDPASASERKDPEMPLA